MCRQKEEETPVVQQHVSNLNSTLVTEQYAALCSKFLYHVLMRLEALERKLSIVGRHGCSEYMRESAS